MLNPKTNERELCYVVQIDAIEPIIGSDNCEAAVVGGWRIMTRKGTFKPGDLAIYFEIDSKVPETETFAFLEKKHYKIKTQKYTFGGKGNFVSQGLLMHPIDFGWTTEETGKSIIIPDDGTQLEKGDFLTQRLGVTYAIDADNKRKGSGPDKYKKMAARHKKIFSNPIVKKIMRYSLGRKIMFLFFGKKKDKKGAWPVWVKKTDEERIQNLVSAIPTFVKEPWVATEKIDGTSTTFTMRGFGRKREFYVCSRNVVFDKPDKNCFYDTNVYLEMSEKYHMEDVLTSLMEKYKKTGIDFITIQGETYGGNIQKRDYGMKEHDLAVFNVIFGYKDGTTERLNPIAMKALMDNYLVPTVPIVSDCLTLPDSCDKILLLAGGPSAIDGGMREGLVFRSFDGAKSFKAVDNNFLIKYHQ